MLPRQIVQTRDAVVISSEDSSGIRVIHLGGQAPPDALQSIGGYSIGRWENDTLVVETTHLRADDPARNVAGRPLLLSRRSKVTERFTRVSPTELFYRYTVEDDELYTRPWSGEFSMMRFDHPIYEYGCHEGNYSLTNGCAADKRRPRGSRPRPRRSDNHREMQLEDSKTRTKYS